MQTIIFTDGSSRGNPGPGGWGAIVIEDKSKVVELGGDEESTTNNRMELMAAIKALEYVGKSSADKGGMVEINSDSEYVVKGMKEWIYGWKQKKWKNSAKKSVMNRDLWEKLDALSEGFKISWKHVRGHAGHSANERCDQIATDLADGKGVKLYNGPLSAYKSAAFSLELF